MRAQILLVGLWIPDLDSLKDSNDEHLVIDASKFQEVLGDDDASLAIQLRFGSPLEKISHKESVLRIRRLETSDGLLQLVPFI